MGSHITLSKETGMTTISSIPIWHMVRPPHYDYKLFLVTFSSA
jgi:hypothetical protein